MLFLRMESAMEDILSNIGQSSLAERFIAEKITPDIVPKLSLLEFEQLGLSNRSIIMTLRSKCSTFSSEIPTKKFNTGGAPKFKIPKATLNDLLDEGFTVKEVSSLLGVSERTIYRRMQEFDIHVRDFDDISDDLLDGNLLPLIKDFPNCGENMLSELLKNNGVKVQRERVRESIHRIYIDGVKQRKKGRLARRVYNVQGANHLWHIDTNHKLVRWYFIIIGSIDGFSRLPVVLDCTTSNKAELVLNSFLKGVEEYGLPTRVRSAKSMGNVLVADYMIEKRGCNVCGEMFTLESLAHFMSCFTL